MTDASSGVARQATDGGGRGLPCRVCDYDLRGSLAAGKCPECGTPLADALRSDQLDRADPTWLRRLARGITLLAAASAIVSIPAVEPLLRLPFSLPTRVIVLLALVLDSLGAWWLTGAEPARGRRAGQEWLRLGARWLLLAGNAVASVPYLGDGDQVYSPFHFVALNLTLAATVLTWLYVRRLLLRIPRRSLAREVLVAVAGFVVCTLLGHWLWWVLYLLNAGGRLAQLPYHPVVVYGQWAFVTYGLVLCVRVRFAFLAAAARPAQPGDHERGEATGNSAGGAISQIVG